MTYTVHYRSAKYGLDDLSNRLEFRNGSDWDEFVEKLASEISRIGLTWVPEFSEVQGPVDLDIGMDDSEFADWFDDTVGRLWADYYTAQG